MFKNALVSVSDKSGLIEFLKPYAEQGLRILSTGGTAKHLKENGFQVVDVSEQTQFPEVMSGRVKTLHPHIHMCLLARGHVEEDLSLLKEYGLEPIDLVIGNLYPFEETLKKQTSEKVEMSQDLSEYIDIGGPSFLRAAAKNFSRITVICDPKDYQWVQEKKELTLDDRKVLAGKVFSQISAYDSLIAKTFLDEQESTMKSSNFSLGAHFVTELRYGENPQQKASWYGLAGERGGLDTANILQGKPLSFNNLLDIEAAVSTLREFKGEPCCVAVKHNNPCGVGLGKNLLEALQKGLKADPVSVFGGILAISHKVDTAEANIIKDLFLECIVAPDFSPEALRIFGAKKNLRVLKWPEMYDGDNYPDIRRVPGGIAIQTKDVTQSSWSDDWQLIGEQPNEKIKLDLLFAWKVCAHLKSNAIAICEGGQSLGLGMGQVNRVDAVEQAILRMKKFHQDFTVPVLASDAFFPFPDSIELAANAKIHWVIQPGGSMRDQDVIAKANELGVNMVLTGKRHFLH